MYKKVCCIRICIAIFYCVCITADKCFTLDELTSFGVKPFKTRDPEVSKVIIERDGWKGHYLTTAVAHILLKETMAYQVTVVAKPDGFNAYEAVAQKRVDANFEVWPYSQTIAAYNEWVREDGGAVDVGFLGIVGASGWYVPNYVIANHPEHFMDFWRAYRDSQTLGFFNDPNWWPSGTTRDELLQGQGREFVPPWCALETVPKDCKLNTEAHWDRKCNVTKYNPTCIEMLGIEKGYDPGILQQQIRNNELNITVLFLSEANYYDEFNSRVKQKGPFLLYYWSPSTFVLEGNLTRIPFPAPTAECYLERDGSKPFQGLGSVDCDFRHQNIIKIRTSHLDEEKYADFIGFVREFTLANHEQNEMLRAMEDFTPEAAEKVACQWLKNNSNVWNIWIPEPPPERVLASIESESGVAGFSLTGIMCVISIILLVVTIQYRHTEAFPAAGSYRFMYIMIGGSFLSYAGLFLMPYVDSFNGACNIVYSLFGLSFVFIFGTIFLKSWRIHWLVTHPSPQDIHGKNREFNDKKLFQYLVLLLLYEIVLDIIWYIVAPVSTVRTYSSQYIDYMWCESGTSPAFWAIWLFPKISMLLLTGKMSYSTRTIPHQFNDSSSIMKVMITIILICIVFGSIMYTSHSRGEFNTFFILLSVTIFFVAPFAIMLILLPKIFKLNAFSKESTGV